MATRESERVLSGPKSRLRSPGRMHVFLPKSRQLPPGVKLAREGGPYTQQGSTDNFNVFYDNSLGANGATLADGVLASCEGDYAQLQEWFGGIAPSGLPFGVYIDPGDFGAFHQTCAATELHCAAFDGTNVDLVRMLVVAEADEVFMAAQNAGWDCGASHGEGLSRVLATERYPAQLNGFASASTWLNSDRPDWVNNTEPTDTNYVSIGCSVLFLNWLRYQLNYPWEAIVAAAAPTLAEVYTNLTGATDGWDQFSALIQANFPAGQTVNLPNDNPFPLPQQAVRRGPPNGRHGSAPRPAPARPAAAQPQTGPARPMLGSSSLIPEIVLEKRRDAKSPRAALAGVTDYGFPVVGPQNWDVIIKSTGWNISDSPTVVLCQARQMDNLDHGWPDQFCIQVIETAPDFVRFRVRRIDAGTDGSGWGQNLRVDTIVIN
jgi:hypothetical protein